ncbi:putative glucose-6-phosphate 1-epimerase [Tanacetum coccineum]
MGVLEVGVYQPYIKRISIGMCIDHNNGGAGDGLGLRILLLARVLAVTEKSNSILVDLILNSTEEELKIWPHRFQYRLRITLGPKGELMWTSHIRNTDTDGKPSTFTFAHHTSISVSNIS